MVIGERESLVIELASASIRETLEIRTGADQNKERQLRVKNSSLN